MQGLPGFFSTEAAGKTEARELSGGFPYRGSALVSRRHPGTGSSFGKFAAVASSRREQVLLKIGYTQQYAGLP